MLQEILPLLGHRNWILIVDKAYPYQSSPGIRYIDTKQALLPVMEEVLNEIRQAPHVFPHIYLDRELSYMNDSLAPGCDDLKQSMDDLLRGFDVQRILHDEVFAKLDQAASLFNVVVLKTESLIPYTSVFIELDCGYWSAEKEKILRNSMQGE